MEGDFWGMNSAVTISLFRFKICQENSRILVEVLWLCQCPWKHFDWGNVHCLIPSLGIKGVYETKNNKNKKKGLNKVPHLPVTGYSTEVDINPWGGNISKGQQGIQKFSIPFLELLSPNSSCITFLFLSLCQTTWSTKTFSLRMLTNTSSNAFP